LVTDIGFDHIHALLAQLYQPVACVLYWFIGRTKFASIVPAAPQKRYYPADAITPDWSHWQFKIE
jgi:hypothetical protein